VTILLNLSEDIIFAQTRGSCRCSVGFGGEGCSDALTPTAFSFSPVTDIPSAFVAARTGHSLVSCYDDALYLFGGYMTGRGVVNDLWRYDPVTGEWLQLQPATQEEPEPRFEPTQRFDE